MTPTRRLALLSFAGLLTLATILAPARADTGVSDERVSLPDGPGSIGGVGENASLDANMGMLSHAVELELPRGFAGATPALALSYSSGAGNEALGIGWTLHVPHIERSSLRGLPRYDADDLFAVDGSQELVRVSGPARTQVFRARFEGGFVRYTWHADADGRAGHFVAEYPDGSRGFFGADAAGKPVASARLTHPAGGVFRYLLVETVDRFGHAVRYRYTKHGAYPLIDEISYLFSGTTPRYRVRFVYEARSDAISSCLAGFDLVLDRRLSEVRILSNDAVLRRYALTYAETAAGTSQLTRVRQYGVGDVLFPVVHGFSYTEALASCADCTKPVVVEMGMLAAGGSGGLDLQNGRSTLIDINGDALPDVLDTGGNGAHRFFVNVLSASGAQHFAAPAPSTRTRGGSAFALGTPGVQAVDVNGDGFTDMIHTVANRVLCNRGRGDWEDGGDCASDVVIEGLAEDEAGDSDPLHIRFFDYDNDKRIDLLHTKDENLTVVLHNRPDGFVEVPIEPIGKVFDEGDPGTLQLGDVNGDGLLDPVDISAGGVSYRLNLGRGLWGPWVSQTLSGVGESELAAADLQDVNGDGLDDVVVVFGNTVQYALNRAGAFLPFDVLGPEHVEGELPTVDASTTVLFADMNASGTTDVVWITSEGKVSFLELFAVRPNLLTRIDNGIGGVQLMEYGTSAREQARDREAGLSWRYRLPQAMNVVTATASYATLTPEVQSRLELAYHHGYYDGLEKRYRGFEVVEQYEPVDDERDSQNASLTELEFDLGVGDPYHAGKLLRQQLSRDPRGIRAVLQRVVHEYDDCPLADVPASGLRLPVRHVCEVATRTVLQEGRPESEWVTLRTEQEYDGHGNVVLRANHGVVGMGPTGSDACAPCTAPEGTHSGACGDDCAGDEAFSETEYIAPGAATGGAWIVGQPSRTIAYGVPGGAYTEALTYYDGEPFVGLPRGQLTRGLATRSCARVTAEAQADCQGAGWVASARARYDGHGNLVESIDPNGSPASEAGHRQRVQYDASGLEVVALEVLLSDGSARPYRLRREVRHDPPFYQPVSLSDWMLVDGGKAPRAAAETRVAYDAFGRRRAIAEPGDTLAAPTTEFAYELADPVSRIVVRTRSKAGADLDLEEVHCVDGLARLTQTRTRLDEDSYQVHGFSVYDGRGAPVRSFQPYQSGSEACESAPPAQVRFTSIRYDALGRTLEVTRPDADLYHGSPSVARTLHAPLTAIHMDPEDNDPASPAADTPVVERSDGLGRLVSIDRYLTARAQGGEPARVRLLYDDLGRVAGSLDPLGHRKAHTFDLLGRVVAIDDPNGGPSSFVYDAAGNVLEHTDARGRRAAMAYDGAHRLRERWDPSDREATLVQYGYDRGLCSECTGTEGRIAWASYPLGRDRGTGKDEVGYDSRGREVFSARTLEGKRLVTRSAYDNAGRLIATTHPDGTVISRQLDAASRLTAIADVLDKIEYDARGELSAVHYANGTRREQTHDAVRRLRSLRTVAADGEVLEGFEYGRDRANNVWSIRDVSSERADRPRFDTSLVYDGWYRLREARLDPGGPHAETLELGHDVLDNITSKTSSLGARSPVHVGSYRYDDNRPNAVVQAGDLSLAYDDDGSLIRRGDTDLSWDYLGRLGEATSSEGTAGELVYGAGVDRVMKLEHGGATHYVTSDFELRDGISVVYVRLGRDRVARLHGDALATTMLDDVAPLAAPDGHITAADAWLARDTAGEEGAARYLRSSARRLLLDTGDDIVFLHADHLGSLTLATTRDGALRGERAFYPGGEERFSRGHVDEHGFTGQEQDEGSGLVRFQHRHLDVWLGRWTSVDPLFSVASEGLIRRLGEATTAYAYVANNPANAVDSTGLTLELSEKLNKEWNEGDYSTRREMETLAGVVTVSRGRGSDETTMPLIGTNKQMHPHTKSLSHHRYSDFSISGEVFAQLPALFKEYWNTGSLSDESKEVVAGWSANTRRSVAALYGVIAYSEQLRAQKHHPGANAMASAIQLMSSSKTYKEFREAWTMTESARNDPRVHGSDGEVHGYGRGERRKSTRPASRLASERIKKMKD